MNEGLLPGCRLVLLSSPPGFGKTTLLTEWLGQTSHRVAWLSLDERDNDPARFAAYLLAAMQRLYPAKHVAASFTPLPLSGESTSLEGLLSGLINDLHTQSEMGVLVLDDYHTITSPVIHQAVTFLIDHLPAQLRVVIAGRADPPLPLPRWRVRAQVIEVRADDLRFTLDEATAFLNDLMGLRLAPADVVALDAQTEGWIAGLQLAALSMQGRSDVAGFIATFTGRNRYVLDYLIEEVLNRQTPDVQAFLLQTSILDRLNGALGAALTDRAESAALLDQLDRSNLFLIPLDQDRTWFRYHHLFVEFLRARLIQLAPTLIPSRSVADLHHRASEWFGQHDLWGEAIEHALRAEDFARAARLIEQTAREAVLLRGQASLLLDWLQALPDDVLAARPALLLDRAWAYVISGQHASAAASVQRVTDAQWQGEVAAIQSLMAVLHGDVAQAIDCGQRALQQLPPDDRFVRGLVALNLGRAYDMAGNLPAADRAYVEAQSIAQALHNDLVWLIATTQLADIKMLQGQLRAAHDGYQQAVRLANAADQLHPTAAMAYSGLGQLLYEWNDLAGAAEAFGAAIDWGRRWEAADLQWINLLFLARTRWAQGALDNTRELMQQAHEAMQRDIVSLPTVTAVQAHAARLHLLLGEVEIAWREAQALQTAWNDDRHDLLTGTTLARCLLARGQAADALHLIEMILPEFETTGQWGGVIELSLLQALTLQAQQRSHAAQTALRRALQLAAPEGYVRLFLDEGAPLIKLLRSLPADEYAVQLLAVANEGPEPHSTARTSQPLIEPLSDREVEVLRLIDAGLSNQEIAQQLVVALSTVKTHINNLYGKLGVQSRTQALARAREVKLI